LLLLWNAWLPRCRARRAPGSVILERVGSSDGCIPPFATHALRNIALNMSASAKRVAWYHHDRVCAFMGAKHTLYIVATPIGHRDDLSIRAIKTLSSVDRILAEDTRHSGKLLRHHGIITPLVSLHEHNEAERVSTVLNWLTAGESLALISDAGTPLISDPGFRLVRECLKAGLTVSPVPGASAVLAALSVSGLPTDAFRFVGFAPARSTARERWLEQWRDDPHTLVLYESPHRIEACLQSLQTVFGPDREMTLARELTKQFETVLHGRVSAIVEQVSKDTNQTRGEFVLMISGSSAVNTPHSVELDALIKTLNEHLPPKTIARCAAELLKVPRQEAYRRVLELKKKD